MNTRSTPQLLEFTNDLDRIAVAIGVVRQNAKLGNGQVLTKEEKDDLLICQIKLFRESSRFLSDAINLNCDQIKQQLAELKTTTLSIDQVLEKMETVTDVIDLSTLALNVATAVTSGDIVSVVSSLNALLTDLDKRQS